jgi:uncharacterized iron-regulated membrane protein
LELLGIAWKQRRKNRNQDDCISSSKKFAKFVNHLLKLKNGIYMLRWKSNNKRKNMTLHQIPSPYGLIIVLAIFFGSLAAFLYWRKAKSDKAMNDLAKKWEEDPLTKNR